MTAYGNAREFWERRKHPRKFCLMSVAFENIKNAQESYISNISTGGVFIKTERSFRMGEDITMHIPNLKSKMPFIADGKVISISNEGIGVRFHGLTQQQQDVIGYLWR